MGSRFNNFFFFSFVGWGGELLGLGFCCLLFFFLMFLFNSSLITQCRKKPVGIKDEHPETFLCSTEVLESHILLEPMNSKAPKLQRCPLKGNMKF